MILGDAVLESPGRVLLHIARDDARMARLADAVNFFHPEIDCLQFPAWDCLPYDRVSPNGAIVSQRMEVLSRLAEPEPPGEGGRLVITTVNAALQRTPSRDSLSGARLEITRRGHIPLDSLVGFLELARQNTRDSPPKKEKPNKTTGFRYPNFFNFRMEKKLPPKYLEGISANSKKRPSTYLL